MGGLYDGDKGGKEFTFTVAENSEYLQIGENLTQTKVLCFGFMPINGILQHFSD